MKVYTVLLTRSNFTSTLRIFKERIKAVAYLCGSTGGSNIEIQKTLENSGCVDIFEGDYVWSIEENTLE